MADPRCPTCHSQIGTDSTSSQGRVQGAQGTDENGNPVPRWSDDPVITRFGLNGAPYQGNPDRPRKKHIQELQEARKKTETDLGITPTDFSDVISDRRISRRHITELRESTERVLQASEVTLEDYFKLDEDGNEVSQNPELAQRGVPAPQTDWVEVDRGEPYINKQGQLVSTFMLPDGTQKNSPTLPHRTRVRAVHIEDLRHPIPIGTPAILVGPLGFFSFPGMDSVFSQPGPSSAMLKGKKGKGALFRDVASCSSTGPVQPT